MRERKRDGGQTQREQSSSRVFLVPNVFVCTQEEAASQAYTHTHTQLTQTFACACVQKRQTRQKERERRGESA